MTTELENDNSTDNTSQNDDNTKMQVSKTGYSFIRSTWMLQAIVIYVLLGTLVFAGIEGHNAKARNFELLIQQLKFNKTRLANRSIQDHDRIYNKSLRIAQLGCNVTKIDVYGWNSMGFLDAFIYSYGIMSTTGWGVYVPKSTLCKIISVVYAIIGVPILAGLIGILVRSFDTYEERLKTSAWIKKLFGNYQIFAVICFNIGVAYIFLQGFFLSKMISYYSANLQANYTRAGLPTSWSLTEGIYFYVINTITLIGFGDQHFIYDSVPIPRLIKLMIDFLFLIVMLASIKKGFTNLVRYFDHSMDKKMRKYYTRLDSTRKVTFPVQQMIQAANDCTINYKAEDSNEIANYRYSAKPQGNHDISS